MTVLTWYIVNMKPSPVYLYKENTYQRFKMILCVCSVKKKLSKCYINAMKANYHR